MGSPDGAEAPGFVRPNVGNDGAGVHTRTDYVFLRAGTHKLSFWVAGGAAFVNGVSVGIDTQ